MRLLEEAREDNPRVRITRLQNPLLDAAKRPKVTG